MNAPYLSIYPLDECSPFEREHPGAQLRLVGKLLQAFWRRADQHRACR